MKYVHIKKSTGSIKYKEIAESSYSVVSYYDVEVPDDYVLEGEGITFVLNIPLTPEEEEQMGLIKTLSDGSFSIEVSKLQAHKNGMLEEYSQMSFGKRWEILKDYKLVNAAMDIYDASTKADYKATIEAFRAEYYRIKGIIDGASDIATIDAIVPNFPTEIVQAV